MAVRIFLNGFWGMMMFSERAVFKTIPWLPFKNGCCVWPPPCLFKPKKNEKKHFRDSLDPQIKNEPLKEIKWSNLMQIYMWRFLLFQRLVPRNSPTKKLAPIVIFNATLLKHVKNHMMKTDSEAVFMYPPGISQAGRSSSKPVVEVLYASHRKRWNLGTEGRMRIRLRYLRLVSG